MTQLSNTSTIELLDKNKRDKINNTKMNTARASGSRLILRHSAPKNRATIIKKSAMALVYCYGRNYYMG